MQTPFEVTFNNRIVWTTIALLDVSSLSAFLNGSRKDRIVRIETRLKASYSAPRKRLGNIKVFKRGLRLTQTSVKEQNPSLKTTRLFSWTFKWNMTQ